MREKTPQRSRVALELLKSLQDLSAYSVVPKADMSRAQALCSERPDFSPERVVAFRLPLDVRLP